MVSLFGYLQMLDVYTVENKQLLSNGDLQFLEFVMSMVYKISNNKIAKNAAALYIRMFIIMAVNFYLARIVLDVLGATDYGIYNVVGTIVVIFTFLKSALSESTQRFLNYEMGKNCNFLKLRNVFSTSMNCYILLLFAVLFFGEIIWYYGGHSLNISQDRYEAAEFTFHLSLLSFAIGILQVPYNATIIAYEKMSFFAKISIVEVILKLFLTFLISYVDRDKLKTYSVLMFFNSFIILLIYYFYCKRNFRICRYKRKLDKKMFARILGFTGWSTLGSLASVFSESGVSLLFNNFCGVLLNAAIGLSNQINNALMGFANGFQTAFKPQLVKICASERNDEFHIMVCNVSRYSYFLFFLICIPIVMNMDYILSLWLVRVPHYTSIFARIIVVGTLIDASSSVFFTSIGAIGNIRNYQISISLVFLLHVVVTCILLYFKIPYQWVFFSRLLTRGLLNWMVGIYFLNSLSKFPVKIYFRRTIAPVFVASVVPITFEVFVHYIYSYDSIVCVLVDFILFEIIALVTIFYCGLFTSERNRITLFIRRFVK